VALLVAPVVLAAGTAQSAQAQPAPAGTIRLGVLTGMFRDVPPDLIQAASSPFRDLFKRETGLNGEVEVVEDCEILAAKMKDKKIHFGVFHGFEYAWVKDRYPELSPLVVSVPNGRKVQACLVVNVASKAESPSDLKGACVTVPVGSKAHCHLFIDRLQESLPSGTCCPAGPRELGPEEALDAVAANKCPAVLVDIASLTAYQNNKPGAAGQLKVLARSELFPPAVLLYCKGAVDPTVLAKVRSGLLKVNENPQGKAFLMLWRLKGFEDPPADYNADLERIRKAYPPPGTK
jgi:ABC-type phosphate/phosphonate transport system substrate-binding protein